MPIHFMHKSVAFDEMIALYAVSDVCLVTSTRDGMNLVSYEYIATQKKRHGVMILSEFTGAAQSLNGSLIVNPWNTEELAGAIHDAVTMGEEQRTLNFEKLDKYVQKYTRYVYHQTLVTCFSSYNSSAWWGQSFVGELTRISEQADKKTKRRVSLASSRPGTANGPTPSQDGTNGSSRPNTANGPTPSRDATNGVRRPSTAH